MCGVSVSPARPAAQRMHRRLQAFRHCNTGLQRPQRVLGVLFDGSAQALAGEAPENLADRDGAQAPVRLQERDETRARQVRSRSSGRRARREQVDDAAQALRQRRLITRHQSVEQMLRA